MMVTRLRVLTARDGLLTACGSPAAPDPDAVPAALVIDCGSMPMGMDPASIDDARIEGDELVLSAEPVLELTLSHHADGDACEALLRPRLRTDLRVLHPGLAPRRSAGLRIYRPGAAAPSADLPYSF